MAYRPQYLQLWERPSTRARVPSWEDRKQLVGGDYGPEHWYVCYILSRFLSHFSPALISSRLLASTTDSDISRRAYKLLKKARSVAYRWICEVREKLNSTQDEATCEGLRLRLCMIAATCFSTFDVCSEHVPAVLDTEEDFSVAMQCAVIVHDNKPPSLSDDNSPYLARMLSRHRRLLHHLEPTFCQSKPGPGVLGEAGLLHADAYDNALKRLWLGYRRDISSRWHVLPRPNSRWISCGAEGGHEVHYDLLTGKLLVDGKPLGRLPQEIVEHPTYASVLGTVSD